MRFPDRRLLSKRRRDFRNIKKATVECFQEEICATARRTDSEKKKKKKKSSFTGFTSPNPERDKGNPMEPEEARRAGVEAQNRETEELTTDSHLSSLWHPA